MYTYIHDTRSRCRCRGVAFFWLVLPPSHSVLLCSLPRFPACSCQRPALRCVALLSMRHSSGHGHSFSVDFSSSRGFSGQGTSSFPGSRTRPLPFPAPHLASRTGRVCLPACLPVAHETTAMKSPAMPPSSRRAGKVNHTAGPIGGATPSAEEERELQERSVLSRAAVGRRAVVLS